MILVIADPSAGGTFLCWSLHYLAGHETYFHARSAQWRQVPIDPVQQLNAHGFRPNQPGSIDDVYDMTKILEDSSAAGFHHLYFHNLDDEPRISTQRHEPTACAIEQIRPKFQHTVLLDNANPLYHATFEPRALTSKFSSPNQINRDAKEQHADFVSYFFPDSLDRWRSLNLTEVWDQREFLALNLRPLASQKMRHNLDLAQQHFHLNAMDLYTVFDQTVDHLFEFLDLSISKSRKSHWSDVYSAWRRLHYNRVMFCWHFDEIINYILQGHDMDLTRFNLDLVQEACIQHFLIYRHDLNFRTFNLDKFRNTRQLHQLLEKNIHPLSAY